jgi:Ankyrin repeats (3 copies)
MGRFLTALACAVAAWGADSGAELRNAARKGQTAQVATLAQKGAPLDTADKNGRTALMMAAERGHADTVKLLLERGAKAEARDREGWTAYGLAVIEGREEVVRIFPAQPPIAAGLDVKLAADNVYTSCFLRPDQLGDFIAGVQPDSMVAASVTEFASLHGRGVAQLVEIGPQVTVALKVRPSISCVQQQTVDNVSLAIDLRVIRVSDGAVLLEKTFGGGLKGLRARATTSPAQYGPLFLEWAKAHASGIYWAAVEGWLRAR